MVELTAGNILDAEAEALVNPVNCVGVMNRGVALQFRRAYPENFKAYKVACKTGQLKLGKVLVFETGGVSGLSFVINFPTKRHWRDLSRIEFVNSGLRSLIDEIEKREIKSVALPPLGCGVDGLNWKTVRPRIVKAFSAVPSVRVLLFESLNEPRQRGPRGGQAL